MVIFIHINQSICTNSMNMIDFFLIINTLFFTLESKAIETFVNIHVTQTMYLNITHEILYMKAL